MKSMYRSRRALLALTGAAGLSVFTSAWAQAPAWPQPGKPIRIVIPAIMVSLNGVSNGVRMYPGHTALTLMPNAATSAATDLVKVMIPAFATE